MARVAQLIGFDVARGGWASANATIGPGDTHRIFYSGALPASFDGDGTPTNITCVVSYKTQTTNVANYVQSIPQNRPVVLIYHHEPEGDYSLGQTFVSEFKAQSDLIRAQGRSNVRVAMCSAGYPYRNAGTNDVLNGNYLRGLGNYVDLFTKDIYQGSAGIGGFDWPSNGLANYPNWTNWLNLVTNPSIVGTVKPLGITEYGVDDPVGNSARNTRIILDHDYLVAAFTPGGASAVSAFPLQMWCYWWQDITGDPNQAQFTDSTTVTTWKGYETTAQTSSGPYLIGSATAALGSATALSMTVGSATAAGDVITVAAIGSSSTVSSVTDSKGNTYTQRNQDTGGVGSNLYQFTADPVNNPGGTVALTTADTITATWASTAPSKGIIAAGCAGLSSAPADQAVNADSAGSAAPSVTSGTLAVSNEIAIAAIANGNGGGAVSWASGWTELTSVHNPNSGPYMSVAWQAEAGTAAVTASGTITSTKWTAELLTFKPAGAPVVAGSVTAEIDIGLPLTAILSTPAPQPAGGSPAPPAFGYPQIYLEAGFKTANPVAAAGTLILDDPVNGKLDTARLGDGITWTDITAFIRSGTVTRASTREQGPLFTYQGASGSVILDDADGRFDSTNLTGPYVFQGASQVGAMTPIRVRAVFGSVEYAVFSGFADAWQSADITYDQGYDEVTLSASDGFKVLTGITIPPATPAAGAGELSGARVTRVLNAAQWFTDHRRTATGNSTVQATTFGDTALNLLQLTADTEIGELYIDGAGNLVYRNRQAILTDTRSTTPQAVFGDLPGTSHSAGTELAYAAIGRANDDTQMANDVQITRVGGVLQEAKSQASITANLFPRTYTRSDVILNSDIEALAYAQWVLFVSKNEDDRFDTLTIDPVADPANLFPQVLGREIGDRIQIWRRPQNSGQTITRDCFIRGIEHAIDAVNGTWQTTWTLQDATKYQGFLILDSTTLGLVGTGALAY